MLDPQTVLASRAAALSAVAPDGPDEPAPELAVRQALAGLKAHGAPSPRSQAAELKYRLTMLLFASILLVFVALYVTSLTAGIEPEVSLFRAGAAAVILAVLARVAVGIIGDESRLVLNDRQIVAMARSNGVRAYLSGPGGEAGAGQPSAGGEQPTGAAEAAGTGGKE